MSRSYRKTPIIKDNGKHKQFAKRQANKKVRRESCGNGAEYKKHYDQYDICDYYCFIDKNNKKAELLLLVLNSKKLGWSFDSAMRADFYLITQVFFILIYKLLY